MTRVSTPETNKSSAASRASPTAETTKGAARPGRKPRSRAVRVTTSPAPRRAKSLPPPQSSASLSARQQAAAILEVLAGLRKPAEAAEALSTSLVRYYQLERRALDGLVAACEPRPKGPPIDPDRRLRELERALVRTEQECRRQEALARVAQRALGLAPAARTTPATARGKDGQKDDKSVSGGGKRRRRRRPVVRALKAAQELRQGEAEPPSVANIAASAGAAPCGTAPSHAAPMSPSPAGPTSLAPPAGSPA